MTAEFLHGELIAREGAFGKRLKRHLLSVGEESYASLFEDAEASELARRILELVGELRPGENDAHRAAKSYLLGCLVYRHAPSGDGGPSIRELVNELRGLLLQRP